MQDGWFVVIALFGLLIFGGSLFVFWLTRMVANHRDNQALTATDLRLLEEAVEALILKLKSASDEAVAEIEHRQRKLQLLLDAADRKLSDSKPEELNLSELSLLAEHGMDEMDIARYAGMSRGEVELLLELQAARR